MTHILVRQHPQYYTKTDQQALLLAKRAGKPIRATFSSTCLREDSRSLTRPLIGRQRGHVRGPRSRARARSTASKSWFDHGGMCRSRQEREQSRHGQKHHAAARRDLPESGERQAVRHRHRYPATRNFLTVTPPRRRLIFVETLKPRTSYAAALYYDNT